METVGSMLPERCNPLPLVLMAAVSWGTKWDVLKCQCVSAGWNSKAQRIGVSG